MPILPNDKMPSLEEYRGRPLRAFLKALLDWLRRYTERDEPGFPPSLLVYTQAGGISARSSTTPGSGTVERVTYNGTALDNSGNGTLTVYNAYGSAFDGSKYVWCQRWKGRYWATTQEC